MPVAVVMALYVNLFIIKYLYVLSLLFYRPEHVG